MLSQRMNRDQFLRNVMRGSIETCAALELLEFKVYWIEDFWMEGESNVRV